MQTRKVGSLDVSVVGLGTNNFGMRMDEKSSTDVVLACLDNGINLFDTADVYGGTKSEEFLGRALGNRRDEAIITTKFGSKLDDERVGAKPAYVRRAAEDSLQRLGTDRIELFLLHRPDPETPIADTLGALNELVLEGKVLEIGCSNFTKEQLQEAKAATAPGAARFVNLQNQYSLLEREIEDEVLAECAAEDITVIPYFPLASGLLTGKYRRNEAPPEGTRLFAMETMRERVMKDRNFDIVEALEKYVDSRNHSLLEAAISWLLYQPGVVSVIAGATNVDQVKSNAQAASWSMSPEEVAEISAIAARD